MFFNVPAAHQGSTPTRDPRVPGITSGGDGSQPSGSRPHREIVMVAMVLVVAVTALVWWILFTPDGFDPAARASAEDAGINLPTEWNMKSIDGGFTVVRAYTAGGVKIQNRYYFDIVETPTVSAPTDLSTWKPQISGATAYAEGEPPFRLLVDAGKHSWIIMPRTLSVYEDGVESRAAWYDLANSLAFTPGT